MNVYIELLEWRGAGPRPVHELAVSTRVYTDGKYDATPDFDSPNCMFAAEVLSIKSDNISQGRSNT